VKSTKKKQLLGVPVNEIDRTVRLAVAGLDIGKFRKENGDDYNINVCLPRADRQTLDALNKVYVSSYTGTSIPLSQLATYSSRALPPAYTIMIRTDIPPSLPFCAAVIIPPG